jgi:Mg-chelatase subunit ChlD
MNTSIVPGSLTDIARQSGQSLAESFVNAAVIVIVDVSGSMNTRDSRGRRSRYDVALEELRRVQGENPGKVAVLGFSDHTYFHPDGLPTYQGSGTDLAGALRFAKVADVPGMQFVVISDGEPNDEESALHLAAQYQAHIHTIYVGPENGVSARQFLDLLARKSGGQSVTIGVALTALSDTITRLALPTL